MGNIRLLCHCYKNLIFAGVLTLFVFNNAFAQRTDSLLNAIKYGKIPDTTRVTILGRLAGFYENSSTDSMILFSNEGLTLANKINYENGKALCQQMLGLAYLHLNDFDKSLNYYSSALIIFQKTGNKTSEGNVLLSMADIYYRQVRYNLAIEYYNKGIHVYDELNNSMGKGFALISIGGIYNDQSNYADGIKYYLKALAAFEKDNYSPGIKMCLTTLATVYTSLGDNKKALEYINKSLLVDDSKSSKEQKALNVGNIATVYAAIKDYTQALLYFNKALAIAESMGDDAWKDNFLSNIADMHYNMHQYNIAVPEYEDVLKLSIKIGDTLSYITAERGIARILIKQGNLSDGIKKLLPVFDLVEKKQIKQTIFETAFDLSEAYEKEGDYAHALQYHKIFADTRDSVFSDKNGKRIQQLQFDYELGEKETQIELLKKDGVITAAKSNQQRIITVALVIGLALLFSIIIILNRSRTYEKNSKEEILRQKEEIQLQASKLEELNRFKDKTFSVLSHDLRSPLNSLTSTVMLLDNDLISPEEFTLLKPELNKQLSSLNILMDNLLIWAKSYIQGKVPANPVRTDLFKIVNQNTHLLNDTANSKEITIVNDVDPSIMAFCDPGQMDIVIRNLISNAIKFTNHNGTVHISSAEDFDNVQIIVQDNGIGMTREQINKAFTTSTDNSTSGTDGERGIGLGLVLCHEFVIANNGSITVTSEVNKGTKFVIELPITAK